MRNVLWGITEIFIELHIRKKLLNEKDERLLHEMAQYD